LPHNSPQLHHKSTTFCTPFSPKTPAKTHIHQRRKKPTESRGRNSQNGVPEALIFLKAKQQKAGIAPGLWWLTELG
jgi:hypothetical protein